MKFFHITWRIYLAQRQPLYSTNKPLISPLLVKCYILSVVAQLLGALDEQSRVIQFHLQLFHPCAKWRITSEDFTSHMTQNRSFRRCICSQSLGQYWRNKTTEPMNTKYLAQPSSDDVYWKEAGPLSCIYPRHLVHTRVLPFIKQWKSIPLKHGDAMILKVK